MTEVNLAKAKPAKARRPSVFVASSSEGLDVAYAIQENLNRDAETTVWPQGVFELSQPNITSLIKVLGRSDFGIFVFTADDRLTIRKKTHSAVRNKVIFELGLFAGRLGTNRVFIVLPDGVDDLRVPTDLVGVSPGRYDSNRTDGNLQAALGPFCNRVRQALRRRRPSSKRSGPSGPVRGAARLRGGLVIRSAEYGVDASWRDVKKPLIDRLKRFGVARVGNDLAGDPQHGTPKTLRIDFTYRGSRHQAEIPEGNRVEFPR